MCSKNKDADQLCGTAQLICVFVFAYAKSRFSHDAAQMYPCRAIVTLSYLS